MNVSKGPHSDNYVLPKDTDHEDNINPNDSVATNEMIENTFGDNTFAQPRQLGVNFKNKTPNGEGEGCLSDLINNEAEKVVN